MAAPCATVQVYVYYDVAKVQGLLIIEGIKVLGSNESKYYTFTDRPKTEDEIN